jgi:catechol 2,3-dioxygenase-like lactoylglutathione lyase family enzyme
MAETQAQVGQQQPAPGPAETGTGGAEQALVGTAAPQLGPTAAIAAPPATGPPATAPAASPAPAAAAPPAPAVAAPAAAPLAVAPPAVAPLSSVLPPASAVRPATGAIHHVELWVPNLDRAIVSWGWLLTSLGYRMFQDWPGGRSWQAGDAYIVVEQSPARTASRHDRCRPGLNHLAFHVATRTLVDELTAEALLHGWKLMFADDHPFAGGPQHYAAYIENADGFEAELVAD